AVVADAVATVGVGEGEAEEVSVRAGRRLRPGGATVRRPVDDALLAGDPRRAGVETGDREERPLGAGILALPRRAAVGGVEDAAELADHPAVAVGREAGAEE